MMAFFLSPYAPDLNNTKHDVAALKTIWTDVPLAKRCWHVLAHQYL